MSGPASRPTAACESGYAMTCQETVLLRAAVRAGPSAETMSAVFTQDAESRSFPDDQDALADVRRRLSAAVADPLLREAVAVSSPSLGRLLDEIAAERPVPGKRLRRAARAVSRYGRRMTDRATPFGLMAGVAVAHVAAGAEGTAVKWGNGQAKVARPSREWLTGLAGALDQDLNVLRQSRVVVNDMVQVRGNRLVLIFHPVSSETVAGASYELSMRCTPSVRTVLEAAAAPASWANLVRVLQSVHENLAGKTERLLMILVQHQVLITDLLPPSGEPDPLGHIARRLRRCAGRGEMAEELAVIRGDLAAYSGTPLGGGLARFETLTGRMRHLHYVEQPVAVDLRLDADVRLPAIVRAEAERVADMLWRLWPADRESPHLREYREAFLERYGVERSVPVLELLDPETGLGPPAGYQYPAGRRPDHAVDGISRRDEDNARDEALLAVAQQAAITGQREVILDENLLTRLTADQASAPPCLDMLAEVRASTARALDDGDFTLLVKRVATVAGSFAGRFVTALEDAGRPLGDVFRLLPCENPGAVRADLSFRAPSAHFGNVAFTPPVLPYRIAIGEFTESVGTGEALDPGKPVVLGIADLAVMADGNRFRVVSRTLGREVVPTMTNMLSAVNTPNAVRLLDEIGRSADDRQVGWRWGTAERLPFLPRIRYGRAVFCLARWAPDDPVLRDGAASPAQWSAAFGSWLRRWQVPLVVQCATADQRFTLSTSDPHDRELLRHEWTRQSRPCYLLETPPDGTGWLGPEGRAHEFAFSLIQASRAARASQAGERSDTPAPLIAPQRARVVYGPGSEWVYAKLYCSPARQDDVLLTRLPEFAASLPPDIDRWFFSRCVDPDPHLRLFFHGTSARDMGGLFLPRLWDWASRLIESGLAARMMLDGYEPEWERYGGPAAMASAERVFDADSRSCLLQLRLLGNNCDVIEPAALAAANYIDILAAGQLGILRDWLAWTDRTVLDRSLLRQAQELAGLDGPESQLAGVAGGPEVLASWRQRAAAIAAYRNVLDPGWSSANAVHLSLLHMHCNRLVGTDRAVEDKSLALARRLVKAHDGRLAALARSGAAR